MTFLKALLHAFLSGAATGAASAAAGSSTKQIGMTAVAGAITGVVSLFMRSPVQ